LSAEIKILNNLYVYVIACGIEKNFLQFIKLVELKVNKINES